jgi:hypothetical protein
MTRFIFIGFILFIANVTLAQTTEMATLIERLNGAGSTTPTEPSRPQTKQEETSFTRPMPFSPFAETYQYDVQRLYEILPKINDTKNIPGTIALVNAELKNLLAGNKQWWRKQNGQNVLWRGFNITPIGKRIIEVHNLNTDYYFWCIYGKVQLFVQHQLTNKPAVKTIANYVIILHFTDGNTNVQIDYFTLENAILTNDTRTLSAISKEATALLVKANQEAYEKVKTKNTWTVNEKSITGKFQRYRNGRVTLNRNNGKTTLDINQFSYDDQILIRGYIDHLGIAIRDR